MKNYNTKEIQKQMQEKYGRITLSIEILERTFGESFLHDLIKQYDGHLVQSGRRGASFETVPHEEVYKMHKQGKSMETICDVFNITRKRFWESVALGCELANKK